MRTLGYFLLGMLVSQLFYQQLTSQNTAVPTFTTQQTVSPSRRNDVCKVYGPLPQTEAAICKKQTEQIQQLWRIGYIVFPPLIFMSLIYVMIRFLAFGPGNYNDPEFQKELKKMRVSRGEPPA